jgi:hypothetical protein
VSIAQDGGAQATELVAGTGRDAGDFACAPNVEGDEIKRRRGRFRNRLILINP